MFKALGKKLADKTLTGAKAETLAKQYLQKQGLEFIEQNYRSRRGEIDLIFKQNTNTIIFVEVKYRSSAQFGHAEEMVTIHKQKKIMKTALSYLQEKRLTESVIARFDVIAIEPQTAERLYTIFQSSIEAKMNAGEILLEDIAASSEALVNCLLNDGKILTCGNGVSAALAQIFTHNLLHRFERDRPSLPTINLGSSIPNVTSIA